MKNILSSFWVNIISSIAFGAVAGLVATYPLGLPILNAIGIGIIAVAVASTGIYIISRKKPKNIVTHPVSSHLDSSKHIEAQTISGGAIIQADKIEQIRIGELNEYHDGESNLEPRLRFITEAAKCIPKGLQILFSIWNDGGQVAKLFEFYTVEYVRKSSAAYYGGQRHVLRLKQNGTTLWEGNTYELPPGESASFDLSYSIKTGPRDGNPWIVFGVVGRYHTPKGIRRELHSDAVYLLANEMHIEESDSGDMVSTSIDRTIRAIHLDRLEEMNEPNMFRHWVYADTLQALSNHLNIYREKILSLMIDDYARGFGEVGRRIREKDEEQVLITVSHLKDKLFNLVERERSAPLDRQDLVQKEEILEQLRLISVECCGRAFVHLCQIPPL